MKSNRKPSQPFLLAQFFVKEVLKRPWLAADNRIAMAHAKSLLKDYQFEDIVGCLEAVRDGVIELPFQLQVLTTLRKYEPNIMERWHDYCKNPPPVYDVAQYKDWLKRTGAVNEATANKQR